MATAQSIDVQDLVMELHEQLEDDILGCDWIVQIARDLQPEAPAHVLALTVYVAVMELVDAGAVQIGDARDMGDHVEISLWQESKEEISQRVLTAVQHSCNGLSREDGFWIEKNLSSFGPSGPRP